MVHTVLIAIHILVCLMLSVVVLLQSSKGGGLAGAFGGAGGAPQQLLGSRGMTTLLHKMTIYLAVGFFVTSFMLFITDPSGSVNRGGVVSDAARQGEMTTLPVQDAPADLPTGLPAEAPAETPAEMPSNPTSTDDVEGGGE